MLANAAGVERFLFASSCSNYGLSGGAFIDESGAFHPVTPYGRSKVEVEAGLRDLADSSFSPTFLRASTPYGLSPRLRFDLVVNNLTAWATVPEELRSADCRFWLEYLCLFGGVHVIIGFDDIFGHAG